MTDKKTVLITGAGSGFGKGAALELAKRGHNVIAGVVIAPQKTSLIKEAEELGVKLQVEVCDINNDRDREAIFKNKIDVLVNNAAIMETGPITEMPMDILRSNFETNFFSTISMTQGFLPQMVKQGRGKIIFMSSEAGLITFPFVSAYTTTKHAIESAAEALKGELTGTGVEVCIINPGEYRTGFNERGAETMGRWFDPEKSVIKPEVFQATIKLFEEILKNQYDPQELIDAIVRIVEEENSNFRNVVPNSIIPWIKAVQARTWKAKRDDSLMVDPNEMNS